MELSNLQKKIVQSDKENIIVIAAAASGKALLNGSLLYTDDGPIKIEDATIGTKIYGDNGELHSIIGVYPQGKKKKYKVVFSDKNEIVCCKDHLWTFQTEKLYLHEPKTFITCSLEELIEKYSLDEPTYKRENIFIPMTEPVNFSKKELPVEPYIVGVSLRGDNSTNKEELSGKEIKFIPDIYKYSSIDDRLELLKGLIDAGGSYNENSYEIILKSKELALDMKEVCESLGLIAIYEKKKKAYHLKIKTSKKIQKIHSSKEIEEQWKPNKTFDHRAIVDIIPLKEEGEMTCIQVDNPNKLFLTNSFIVTHNTAVLTERVKWLLDKGADPEKMVVFTFTNAAAEEMKKRIGDKGEDVFINTIHSYAFYLLTQQGISVSAEIDDENFDEFFVKIAQNPKCIQEVDYLLLDEAQDSNTLQYQFIFDMIKPKKVFIVGDVRQSIYEFSGGRPDLLIDLSYRKGFVTYSLNENYRNGPSILNFAKRIISGSVVNKYGLVDDSVCMNEFAVDKVIEIPFSVKQIIYLLKKEKKYGEWFILTRSNAQIDFLMRSLEKESVPCDTFKRSEISSQDFAIKMKRNSVKILTVHAAKGLEAENVIVVGVSKWDKRGEERRIAYVAATRAKKQLIWTKGFKKKPSTAIWE